VATTAFVLGQASAADPVINGTAAAGSSGRYARADHVHPTDTTRAPVASPTFTGTPAAPTPAADTDTTQLATTAYVVGQNYTKQTRTIFAGAGLTGGGDLSANRTIAADLATQAEAEAGTSAAKLMTPQRVAQAIAVLVAPEEYGTITAETFATSGTFTKHADDLSYIVYCVAGGGGGGKQGTSSTTQPGKGGGGGAGNWQHLPATLFGATVTVTVGSGGLGATSSAGAKGLVGGASSFGDLVFAYGGGGGGYPLATGSGGGGVQGPGGVSAGAGGDKTTSIYGGGAGSESSSVSANYGAHGGSSTNSSSRFAGNGGVDGATGATPGGGGGAGVGTTQHGGNGAPGRVTVYRIKRK
jgi:hypothetical protein